MMSSPKSMAKFGPPRNQTNCKSFKRFWKNSFVLSWTCMFMLATFREILLPSSGKEWWLVSRLYALMSDLRGSISRNVANINIQVQDKTKLFFQNILQHDLYWIDKHHSYHSKGFDKSYLKMYFLLNLSHCVSIYVKFGFFLPCPLTKYSHVTWPKLQMSKISNFGLILH